MNEDPIETDDCISMLCLAHTFFPDTDGFVGSDRFVKQYRREVETMGGRLDYSDAGEPLFDRKPLRTRTNEHGYYDYDGRRAFVVEPRPMQVADEPE